MVDYLKQLFSADGFMPHGHCYLWRPGVLWLHITSDLLIALAYYSIPFTLIYFTRKRRDVPFNWMFLCFAIFIIACGTTHLMEIWVIWHPTYWLSGAVKAITALVSVPTAILLVKLLPQALALPSPKALKSANEKLEREISERQRAEEAVRKLNEVLEQHVAERTQQLETSNQTLVQEAQERQRLEQKTRKNEKLFQAIIDNSQAVIYVKDLQGHYLLVNRRFTEIFHLDQETVIGSTDHVFFNREAADAFRLMDERVKLANCALTEEEIAPHDDGQHTYVSVKSPLWDDAGNPYAIFGISTDITEHKQAEAKARWLASFPERNPNPIIELDATTRTIHYFNPAAAKLLPELESRGLDHPFLTGVQAVTEALLAGNNEAIRREISLGESHYSQTISYISENRRLRVYSTDITERKQAEERLEASLREVNDLKTALDEHAIVAITDPQGKITYVNEKFCAISKYSREELIGQDHRLINSGYHSKQFIHDLWATIANGKVWHGEIKNKAKDDTFYWVDTTIVPFLNENGKPRQYVAIRADITERKNAATEIAQLNAELEERVAKRTAELEAANKELEAFSYSVSHDLRAPLRAINGFAGIVLSDFGPQLPDEARDLLTRVRNGGQRMGELIDNLLAFSRLGRQSVKRQKVNSKQIIHSVLDELKSQRDGRQIELRIGELPLCRADPMLLKQVWINLLSNAIKYTRTLELAVVEIGCERNNGENIYFVRDNGVGFDMQYVNKLFGVFQRLHRAEDFEGTGVGLAIVHRIIHRHDGRIWADAKVNGGATFYFTLEGKND